MGFEPSEKGFCGVDVEGGNFRGSPTLRHDPIYPFCRDENMLFGGRISIGKMCFLSMSGFWTILSSVICLISTEGCHI